MTNGTLEKEILSHISKGWVQISLKYYVGPAPPKACCSHGARRHRSPGWSLPALPRLPWGRHPVCVAAALPLEKSSARGRIWWATGSPWDAPLLWSSRPLAMGKCVFHCRKITVSNVDGPQCNTYGGEEHKTALTSPKWRGRPCSHINSCSLRHASRETESQRNIQMLCSWKSWLTVDTFHEVTDHVFLSYNEFPLLGPKGRAILGDPGSLKD